MVNFLKGDILTLKSPDNIIVHQVNCQGVMGAGLAKQIRANYPVVYQTYKDEIDRRKQARDRFSSVDGYGMLGRIQVVHTDGPTIINLFAQNYYGRDKQYTDYTAFKSCLKTVNTLFKGKTISIPWGIGCGLAGGDWDKILSLIKGCLQDCTVNIYKLN